MWIENLLDSTLAHEKGEAANSPASEFQISNFY